MRARRCETGTLELGAGLDALVAATLVGVPDGEELDVASASRAAAHELAAWARQAGHQVTSERHEGAGRARRFVVRVRRAARPGSEPGAISPPSCDDGRFPTERLRDALGPAPALADRTRALVPLGALADALPASRAWRRSERDLLWADELARLADRANRAQWDATTDVPWQAAQGLAPEVERAVAQVMTYIAQNEYAAYYVPARYLADVNPEYLELLMWLASHVHDEARHIEVFTKRALAGGVCSPALASTELSLQTLLDEHDFSASALLLNVLGEGTFSDLLAFVARHAPDAASATAARLAHRDERRHVHFGIAHVRRRLHSEPELRERLVAAVEARAAKLADLGGLSPLVSESLVLMSARSWQPGDVGEAGAAVRRLLERMHENRIRRLRAAGFDAATARHLSELHTPNLM